MALQPLDQSARVFRLVSHTPEHFPSGADKPHPEAFRLTDDDHNDAKTRGIPPLFSVYDASKTTTTQARAIRKAQADETGRALPEMTPFELLVSGIRTVSVPRPLAPLDVVSDPEDPKWGPGSEGHSGITGLEGKPGTPNLKLLLRQLRSDLRDLCMPMNET